MSEPMEPQGPAEESVEQEAQVSEQDLESASGGCIWPQFPWEPTPTFPEIDLG